MAGRRLVAAALFALLLVAACSTGDDPTDATPTTMRSVPWDTATATFEPVPSAPGSLEEPMEDVPVQSIVWTEDGYRASVLTGSAWRSGARMTARTGSSSPT